jgi:23S rRNA (cytidine1920-2'-O)/16S rRNA (cytidine1409-2'-O)-methyltransferase
MQGQVMVDDVPCTKPGTLVRLNATVRVRGGPRQYASRAATKLEAALTRFRRTVRGRTILDAGASTGGFTDCLLQHGAAKVYAVDVGYGQLRGWLANHPRVVNLERTNISDLAATTFEPALDMCVFDLSYLSFPRAVGILKGLFVKELDMVGLIKPMYEGVSTQDRDLAPILFEMLVRTVEGVRSLGVSVDALMPSPIRGSNDVVEFLASVRRSGESVPAEKLAREAVREIEHGRV